jgi:hypothetical protein
MDGDGRAARLAGRAADCPNPESAFPPVCTAAAQDGIVFPGNRQENGGKRGKHVQKIFKKPEKTIEKGTQNSV